MIGYVVILLYCCIVAILFLPVLARLAHYQEEDIQYKIEIT